MGGTDFERQDKGQIRMPAPFESENDYRTDSGGIFPIAAKAI